MKIKHLGLLTAAMLPILLDAADGSPKILLHKALDAQGGEDKLRAIKNVQWEAAGYRNELEESERPEGPYITDFLAVTETHDFQGDRYRSVTEANVYPVYKTSSTLVVNKNVAMRSAGGHSVPGTPQVVQLMHERVALSPERLLLTALDAPDTHREPDTVLQSVPQNVVAFTLDGAPVRIFLNAYTHLPTAVGYSGPLAHNGFWGFWAM